MTVLEMSFCGFDGDLEICFSVNRIELTNKYSKKLEKYGKNMEKYDKSSTKYD